MPGFGLGCTGGYVSAGAALAPSYKPPAVGYDVQVRQSGEVGAAHESPPAAARNRTDTASASTAAARCAGSSAEGALQYSRA